MIYNELILAGKRQLKKLQKKKPEKKKIQAWTGLEPGGTGSSPVEAWIFFRLLFLQFL